MLDEQPLSDGYATRRYRGERLRDEIARRGADQTAWAWAMEEVETPDLVLRSKAERKDLAAVGEAARRDRVWGDKAKPVATTAPVIVEEVPTSNRVSFEDCTAIWIDLDDTLAMTTIEDMILDPIEAYRSWRGETQKTIRVRWWIRGDFGFHDFTRWSPSEDDIETLKVRLNRYISNTEYVA